ncbi:MAG TPA: hemerythrin domain-containing protein [Thermoanaerobaculia bacterium]|nr:hemerythrin domain-containing protein [Thermoanaerobaculia bacterium]
METETRRDIERQPRTFETPPSSDLLSRFDALAPGESLTLETESEPARELADLQEQRPGRFEWSPDLAGPASWRTTVTRRFEDAGRRRTVSDALAWDHDRLDAIERSAFAALDRGEREEASRLFETFARGLGRHIGFEEAILFPAFENATGHPAGAGPTSVMREEHRIIGALLADIAREIRDPSASPIGRRRSLAWVLGEHNQKEEEILYPMTDAALGSDGADRLVREIQAFRT